jgi:opacity protein-like surface antigen
MKTMIAPALLLGSLTLPTAALAQSTDWTGFYAGGRIGGLKQPSGNNERVEFDTNLDGSFGDTVRTAAGADAFSPGFCDGAANDRTPAAGCVGDDEGADGALMLGYDVQFGSVLVGLVGEIGRGKAEDSVAAFSTTPAFYTMTRRLRTNGAIRARVGVPFGDTLPYLTAGVAAAKIDHRFVTSNGINSFTERGDDKTVYGSRVGAGVEQRFGRFTIGALYLYSNYKDDDYRVRAAGPAPATNPFILVNPSGTDFRRSDERFKTRSLSATASYHF